MIDVDPAGWLTASELQAPLTQLLGREVAAVDAWTCQRLTGGGGEALGVWEVTGTAIVEDASLSWALVLKGWACTEVDSEPTAWNWPYRELQAYTCGLLDDLPYSFVAPACYGHFQHADGSQWLWLERVVDDASGPWPLERFVAAAQRLGRLNGSYLSGRALPDHSWLSRNWLRQWVEAAAPAVDLLARSTDHPMVRQTWPPEIMEAHMRFWEDRHAVLAMLDALPRTFCHLDAFARNLFFRTGAENATEIVAIDWGFCGLGVIGEDLAPLLVGSVAFMAAPAEAIRSLEAAALDGYVSGLRDSGWDGDPHMVRISYAASAVLRYGLGALRPALPALLNEEAHPFLEQLLGYPMADIAEQRRHFVIWMVELLSEVRDDLVRATT
jgi:hypothetical protein